MDKLVILVLATWRLTSLFVSETGPFKIFRRIREWTGIIHDREGMVVGKDDSLLAGLLSCFWCTSIWVAGILSIFMLDLILWLPLTLFASAGAIIIEEGMGWLELRAHNQT